MSQGVSGCNERTSTRRQKQCSFLAPFAIVRFQSKHPLARAAALRLRRHPLRLPPLLPLKPFPQPVAGRLIRLLPPFRQPLPRSTPILPNQAPARAGLAPPIQKSNRCGNTLCWSFVLLDYTTGSGITAPGAYSRNVTGYRSRRLHAPFSGTCSPSTSAAKFSSCLLMQAINRVGGRYPWDGPASS